MPILTIIILKSTTEEIGNKKKKIKQKKNRGKRNIGYIVKDYII